MALSPEELRQEEVECDALLGYIAAGLILAEPLTPELEAEPRGHFDEWWTTD